MQGFDLSIGGVPLQIETGCEELLSTAAVRYEGFLQKNQAPIRVRINPRADLAMTSSEFEYTFEGATVRANAEASTFDGVKQEFSLDAMLRIWLTWALLPRSGFLLHAATVVRNGKAYVFTGRSGAGKSTVASLAPEGSVLTDEISLLRREDGEWRAYGTPFWGEFRAVGLNQSAPVAGIFRLLQSPANRVERQRTAEVVRFLLPNVLFFSKGQAQTDQLLNIVTKAAGEVPGYHLEFRKERDFWEVLPA
jgi:hypothetical protein